MGQEGDERGAGGMSESRKPLILLALLALAGLPAADARADEASCPRCAFRLEAPKAAVVAVAEASVSLTVEGLALEAHTAVEDFEAQVLALSDNTAWRRHMEAWSVELQGSGPDRGVYRGAPYAARAGTAIVRGRKVWFSRIIFDHEGGQVTTLTWKIDGNPSPPALLEVYNAMVVSVRFKRALRPVEATAGGKSP